MPAIDVVEGKVRPVKHLFIHDKVIAATRADVIVAENYIGI